jgi:DNA (cytosine-5)-methyltransferase 1
MSQDFTYAELFAGAGGLSMGLETAGWLAVAHAEIEPHARAVLREHWPTCRLDGDVLQVNGADYAGVMLLSGGSPCQDLSVAGKRSGMTEGSGTRSSLYFEQVRIWQESGAPYFLWENVLGAFSSNDGRDFAAVLSAIVGAAIAVPSDGWQSAGVAAGSTGVAAWRVLDCQYFGPPQRRRRVFVLGARTGGVDPATVLSVGEGLCGDSAPSGGAGQGTPADATGRADRESVVGWDDEFNYTGEVNGTLKARAKSGSTKAGVVAVNISNAAASCDVVMGTLGARSGGQEVGAQTRGVVLAFDTFNQSLDKVDATLSSGESGRPVMVTYDARGNGDGDVVNTLAGDHQNRITDYTALVLRNREGKPGGGKGPLVSAERQRTLGTHNDQVVFPVLHGIPRRLMPVETERLMGWPDGWTATGVDETGRRYALSDTARYRLCGNGVAAPVAAWIGWRLREAIEARRHTLNAGDDG